MRLLLDTHVAIWAVMGSSHLPFEVEDVVADAANDASRPGDPVRLCLVSFPQNRPAGDDRGKIHRATNLRTNQSWTLPDSQHMCGGA